MAVELESELQIITHDTTGRSVSEMIIRNDREMKEQNRVQNYELLENVIFIIAGQIGVEAIEDRIFVLLDKYKSGSECKMCDGTGIWISCECEKRGTPGRYSVGNIDRECRICEGKFAEQVGTKCIACKGHGSLIIIPDSAKSIPTTGVIVSTGPKCKTRKIGERVVYGAHTGYYIPFKGNATIRAMREDEPLGLIHSIDRNLAMSDFLQIEDSLDTLNRE
jgi:hypothetical protein